MQPYVIILAIAIIVMTGIGLFVFMVPRSLTSASSSTSDQMSSSDWDNSNVWRFGGHTSATYYNAPARGAECDYCGCPAADGTPPRIDPGCPPQVLPCPARNYCGSNSKGWSGYAPF